MSCSATQWMRGVRSSCCTKRCLAGAAPEGALARSGLAADGARGREGEAADGEAASEELLDDIRELEAQLS